MFRHDQHEQLVVLDAELEPEAAAADRVERRIRPGAIARPGQQHAVAALAAEKEAGLEDPRADHHGLGPAQQVLRIMRHRLRHHVLHRQRGAIDQASAARPAYWPNIPPAPASPARKLPRTGSCVCLSLHRGCIGRPAESATARYPPAGGRSTCAMRGAPLAWPHPAAARRTLCHQTFHHVTPRHRPAEGYPTDDHPSAHQPDQPPQPGHRGRFPGRLPAHRHRPRADRARKHLRSGPPHQNAPHRRAPRRTPLFPEGPGHRRVVRRLHLHGPGYRESVRRPARLRRIDLRQLRPRPAVQQDRPRLRPQPHAGPGAVHRLHPPDDHPPVRLPRQTRPRPENLGRSQQTRTHRRLRYRLPARDRRPALLPESQPRRLQDARRVHTRAAIRPRRRAHPGGPARSVHRRQEPVPRALLPADQPDRCAAKLPRPAARTRHPLPRSDRRLARHEPRHRPVARMDAGGAGKFGVTRDQVPPTLTF